MNNSSTELDISSKYCTQFENELRKPNAEIL